MKQPFKNDFFSKKKADNTTNFPTPLDLTNLRLNKFMAHCGVGTRRACEAFIKKGLVKVNDKVVTEAAYRVQETDVVKYEGRTLEIEKEYIYVLLNKPKNYHVSFELIEGEKSLKNIFSDKIKTPISPVGDFDRSSLGLLLLTDDEALMEKLNKPENEMRQIFKVTLAKPISKTDLENLQKELLSETNTSKVVSVNPFQDENNLELTVETKGGSDKTILEFFKEKKIAVEIVDRTFMGGLTKKSLSRGRFRFLTEKEAIFLKHFG